MTGTVFVTTTNDYGVPMAQDQRVVIPVRLRSSSVERLDQIATENEWSRSDAMRYLFRLGLAEHDRSHLRPVTVDEAPAPAGDFAARHARLNQHKRNR